jgi:diaminohydroxyphosphoribosylaminopyrimidine deaminase/5-amino-6-(5-phosphoribosylamino)uracil reductase
VSAATSSDEADLRFMRVAVALAARGLGVVWPNPAVGCLLVRDGRVLARGWTQAGGRPHAEAEALARAGPLARGATAYISLEPCAHYGKTGPCADALIAAGIARAVIGVKDPYPEVNGAGMAKLEAAGIDVELGVGEEEASEVVAGYVRRIQTGRPLVALKLAASLDGRIATHRGEAKWITGDIARARVQLLRARYDAVAVGVGTAAADDPELTCRLPGLERRSPVRIVFDSHLRLPLTSRLVRQAKTLPTWLIAAPGGDPLRARAYRDCGLEVITVETGLDGRPDLRAALGALGARGLTQMLVEGGSHLAGALIRDDLVDRLYWFRSPRLIGGDGLPAVSAFGLRHLIDAKPWRRVSVQYLGEDLLETYARPR